MPESSIYVSHSEPPSAEYTQIPQHPCAIIASTVLNVTDHSCRDKSSPVTACLGFVLFCFLY